MSRTKLYKLSNTLIGFLIGAAACWYLLTVFQERASEFNLTEIKTHLKSSSNIFLVVLLLMPFNWGIEVLKWRTLVQEVSKVSYWQAIRSVLFGVSLSLLTPNRLGELGGRLLYIPRTDHLKVLYVNTLCSFSQLMITVVIALIMLPYFPFEFGMAKNLLWTLIIVLLALLFYIYFSSTLVKRLISKINNRFQFRKLESLVKIPKHSRLRTLLFSTLRYAIFLGQFSLLFQIFDPSIPLQTAILASGIIFFVSTLIPTAWISDLAVRTSAAFIIMEHLGYSGSAALISSLLLWAINLFFPALLGLFEFRKVNWVQLKSFGRAD
ncbi:MAG: lysylphosphatidylglycerol synthase domain-containing protein [Vicingaceae bacterium]